jgi:hypothetical protein
MERLRSLCPSSLDMYVFEKETYELVEWFFIFFAYH